MCFFSFLLQTLCVLFGLRLCVRIRGGWLLRALQICKRVCCTSGSMCDIYAWKYVCACVARVARVWWVWIMHACVWCVSTMRTRVSIMSLNGDWGCRRAVLRVCVYSRDSDENIARTQTRAIDWRVVAWDGSACIVNWVCRFGGRRIRKIVDKRFDHSRLSNA